MIFSNSKLSIAPMMDWTDKHFRYFVRQFTRKTVLYSEMITAQAIVYGNPEKLLSFNPLEKPLILQLGGANPEFLAKACQIANDFDYDGINLNGYEHHRVFHSENEFARGKYHVNGIENFWSFAKRRLSKFNGCKS